MKNNSNYKKYRFANDRDIKCVVVRKIRNRWRAYLTFRRKLHDGTLGAWISRLRECTNVDIPGVVKYNACLKRPYDGLIVPVRKCDLKDPTILSLVK